MLIAPALSHDEIAACLYDNYGVRAASVTFLPIGDANSAHYRVEAEDGTPYFLKLRREDLDDVAVEVPAALRAQGIRHVMAPLATRVGRLQLTAYDFHWILYPYVVGQNGFKVPLSAAQWVVLGQTMRAVHAVALPPALLRRMPREDYAPRWRERVRAYQRAVETSPYDDPLAAALAAFWRERRDEIRTLVTRAEELGKALQRRDASERVVCHTDLHAGNVLISEHDAFYVVDWDNPLLAPKERDLMFIGGGIGGIWNTPEEERWFYQGYGATEIDLVALAYYRYERIVVDLAVFGDEVFGVQGSEEDRRRALRITEQFLPSHVVEIAHQTYAGLTHAG